MGCCVAKGGNVRVIIAESTVTLYNRQTMKLCISNFILSGALIKYNVHTWL